MREIVYEITITESGDYKLEVMNHTNSGCLQDSSDVESALGTVQGRVLKPEAQIEPVKTQQIQQSTTISM